MPIQQQATMTYARVTTVVHASVHFCALHMLKYTPCTVDASLLNQSKY
jgi:hypothetical protein